MPPKFHLNPEKLIWEASGIGFNTGPEKNAKNMPVWGPLDPEKLSSRCSGSSIFEDPGVPKPVYFLHFFLVLYWDLFQRLPESIFGI